MNILWLCNCVLPNICRELGLSVNNSGGWLIGLLNNLMESNQVKITVVFPNNKKVKGKINNINYYGFSKKYLKPTEYDVSVEVQFEEILKEVNPDIIHIFGTEFPHSLSMVKVFNKPERTIINIQGLCSGIYEHYLNGIPNKFKKRVTFRDLIKRDSLIKQKESFGKRGVFEVETLKKCKYVIGRTTWDKVKVLEVNENLKYHFCNETLRNEFYKYIWDVNKCEKYSIFISQGSYPVKGLHFMLEAMPMIIKDFPKVHLYIGGENIIKINTLKDRLKQSSYSKYILHLIGKYNLKNHVTFVGKLDEKEMCQRYLKANVFVSASNIENSSNSLGEAMLLGVPCIASYVGGIPDLMEHKKHGFMYQHDAPYMLANYVCDIFKNKELAIKFSKIARQKALITHDKNINTDKTLEIYNFVMKNY